jgi:DNA-directed RNA polymerase specialized sigma24 family protein
MSHGATPRPGTPGRGHAPLQRDEQNFDDGPPRAHDNLERLLGDSDLLFRLQLSGYAEEEWQPVAAEFARYGLGVLQAWIATGKIFARVRAVTGYRLTPPELGFDYDAVQTLATDTVVAALRAFLEKVLKQNRWDPTKGASLKTFFVGQCMFQFSNAYRKWWRQQRWKSRVQLEGIGVDLEQVTTPSPSADQALVDREEFDAALGLLSTATARTAFAMQNMGYTHEEIALELGLADAKAVENVLGYQRRRLQAAAQTRRAQ